MNKKILLVEDDESLGFVTRDNLESRGFNVILCTDGQEAWQVFNENGFDLCILDVMLPKMDGFSLAQQIRQKNKLIPIIFLTAKTLQEDKIEGFKIGGDDYVTKPFSIDELVLRIEVFLRRGILYEKSNEVRNIGIFEFDVNSFSLSAKGATKKFTRRESEILQYLSDRTGNLVKREEILIALWGENDYFKGRSLDVFISKLRKALSADPNVDIENYHGVGFKLVVRG